jgi:hypothetical protein
MTIFDRIDALLAACEEQGRPAQTIEIGWRQWEELCHMSHRETDPLPRVAVVFGVPLRWVESPDYLAVIC